MFRSPMNLPLRGIHRAISLQNSKRFTLLLKQSSAHNRSPRTRHHSRNLCTASRRDAEGHRLVYSEHGNPSKVLRVESFATDDLIDNLAQGEVLLEMLAAPINPADINTIEGVYPKRPVLPAVGGNEGVARVAHVHGSVLELNVGDWVVPGVSSSGTWCSHTVANVDNLLPVPSDIPIEAAATIAVNPCTAYRMLRDFVPLSDGDTIIQNGSNSAVGQSVIQMAREMGVNTINIIRGSTATEDDRASFAERADHLYHLGATVVLCEDDVNTMSGRDIVGELSSPTLALNCVGGRSSLNLAKALQRPQSVVVTYGGMSKRPVSVPTGKLIFNDLSYRGFWMTRWNEEHAREERVRMVQDVAALVHAGALQTVPHRTWALSDALDAVAAATQPGTGVKEILKF